MGRLGIAALLCALALAPAPARSDATPPPPAGTALKLRFTVPLTGNTIGETIITELVGVTVALERGLFTVEAGGGVTRQLIRDSSETRGLQPMLLVRGGLAPRLVDTRNQ
ncbi:MAG TPA: hypothetical protein VGQ83_14775 [Polyangia bacterium]|jgi:hypothetical protein